MNPVKLIISNKANLTFKYQAHFPKLLTLLKKLQVADRRKGLDTKIIFIDDASTFGTRKIKPVRSSAEKECKRIIDDLYKAYVPAYIVILGAMDVIPFQDLNNPAEDSDTYVYSDLPYACDAPFSRRIVDFTGPTRVVGRIPDLLGGQQDIKFLETVINNAIKHKPLPPDHYRAYFAITASDWKSSTEISLQNMFGDYSKLNVSPAAKVTKAAARYTKAQLKPRTHFYNCHGRENSLSFYGQKGDEYSEALHGSNINKNLSAGTIAIAECCFGSQLFDTSILEPPACSIAHNYLANNAIAFVGSSTVSYGPTDSQSLSDLITQHFVSHILKGSSTGRALLEARQRFLSDSGPDLDPYELKTIAQYYLLGDPSVQPADCEDAEVKLFTVGNAIANTRKNLYIKGISLQKSISTSTKQQKDSPIKDSKTLSQILKKADLEKKDKSAVFNIHSRQLGRSAVAEKMESRVKFHTYVKDTEYIDRKLKTVQKRYRVLVVKENKNEILGWRVYESK